VRSDVGHPFVDDPQRQWRLVELRAGRRASVNQITWFDHRRRSSASLPRRERLVRVVHVQEWLEIMPQSISGCRSFPETMPEQVRRLLGLAVACARGAGVSRRRVKGSCCGHPDVDVEGARRREVRQPPAHVLRSFHDRRSR